MKFGFVAKHRGIWPVAWLCEALGVSRSGFHAWLGRPPSERSRSDEAVGAKVRASFLASDRTYDARPGVWHDVLADGVSCGLYRVVRSMRAQPRALARDGVAVRPIWVSGPSTPSRPRWSIGASRLPHPIANGSRTSRISGRRKAGSTWRRSSTCSRAGWSAGR